MYVDSDVIHVIIVFDVCFGTRKSIYLLVRRVQSRLSVNMIWEILLNKPKLSNINENPKVFALIIHIHLFFPLCRFCIVGKIRAWKRIWSVMACIYMFFPIFGYGSIRILSVYWNLYCGPQNVVPWESMVHFYRFIKRFTMEAITSHSLIAYIFKIGLENSHS